MINERRISHTSEQLLRSTIRGVPDFPQNGILFQDITPMLGNMNAFATVIGSLANRYDQADIEQVVGLDARGFIFGGALAFSMNCGFVPARKAGKLPGNVHRVDYGLEYGKNTLELAKGSVAGKRCLVIDDVLATGGSAHAACDLVQRDGGEVVAVAFVIELLGLYGRAKVRSIVGGEADIFSLLTYP